MRTILEILNELSSTTKTTEKIEILKNLSKTEEEQFKYVAYMAYEPTLNYYIKEFNEPSEFLGCTTLGSALDDLKNCIAGRVFTGNMARDYLKSILEMLNEDDAEVLKRVVRRDLRIGVGVTTFNKIWPNLIYDHPYMRCSSFSAKNLSKMSFPLISQRKMDGLYCDIIVTEDKVEYRTRNGGFLDFNTDEIDKILIEKYPNLVFMGEGVALNEDKCTLMDRSLSNGYMNSDDIDPERVCFYIWDIVPLSDFENRKCTIPYVERFDTLTSVINRIDLPRFEPVDSIICENVEEVLDHFKENRLGGHEGTVIKNFDTIWKHGTSTSQIKIKVVFECELKVIGYKPGSNKYEGQIGSLQFTSSDGLVNVFVGSGLTDEQRIKLMDEIEFLISKGAIATIKANDVTKTTDKDGNVEYSLFLGRFKNWRIDKDEADSLERIQEQVKSFTDALKLIKVDA